MQTYKNLIAGEWVESASQRTMVNLNPADTRDAVGRVKLSTAEEVARAVEAAARALPGWRAVPVPQRGRVVARAHDLLARRAEEVARAMSREEGKLVSEARGEVTKTLHILEFFAGEGMRLSGETLPSELPHTFCYTIRQPVGVVAAVTPWNFPLAIPLWKTAPALVYGCTVVLKPSSLTPETARLVGEIWNDAGVPAGAFNLVYAAGGTAGEVFVQHPAVRAITFTGSNEVGMGLYAQAAARGKKVQCEMGGKNAAVVLEDADLDLAADGIVQGAFGSTGQRCTATSRVVVIQSVADELVDRLRRRAEAIRPGEEIGPVVDEQQMKTVLEYIEIGQREGAVLVCGGRRFGPPTGFFVAPTVFDHVRSTMRIAQEEIFGPLLSVLRVRSFEEAVEVTNGVRYGLTSSIYAQDPGRIFRFLEQVETGIVHVNSPTVGGEAQLPFGGMKETGIGTREMGRTAADFFTEIKTVYFDYTGRRRETTIY